MSNPLKVNFLGMSATVHSFSLSQYRSNDAVAVIADIEYSDGDREQLPISINLDGVSEELGELNGSPLFAVKNYSEREELYAELVKGNWIQPTPATVMAGYAMVPVCRLGDAAIIKQLSPANNG